MDSRLRINRSWMGRGVVLGLLAAVALAVATLTGPSGASAGGPTALHGIGFNKGCASPTVVGEAYTCTLSVTNSDLVDTAGDTLTISSISDVVHADPSDVPSGNILSSLSVATIVGGASCNVSGTATGPSATGNTQCTLPSNSAIIFSPFSFYTVDADDPNPLTDTAMLVWQDTCDSEAPNCPVGNQSITTGSQSAIHTPTPTPTNTPTPTATPTPGNEGCTPGYWKTHLGSWGPTGYSPFQDVDTVFSNVNGALGNSSLLQALDFGGGPGVNGAKMILLRAAVAALLNAAHPDVGYALSEADVISMVNAALASNDRGTILDLAEELDIFNNAGCPIDAHGDVIT